MGIGPEKGSEKMSEKIVELMMKNPDITIAEIAQKLQRTSRTVERLINRLKFDTVTERIGPDKGGHWEIMNKTGNKQSCRH